MVPDIITSKLLPSSSTFSTGPLAVTIQPIYTHYPTWDISLPVIWQRVEPQWNYQRAKLQFLMLVGKGKFKYSEDLEGRRHMGTALVTSCIFPTGMLALLETSLIQGQQRESNPIHNSPGAMAGQSDSTFQPTGKIEPQSFPTHSPRRPLPSAWTRRQETPMPSKIIFSF